MAKWVGKDFEHEGNPLSASGWLHFFRQNIRGFQWSQYDNIDYFGSLEKILEVLNTTKERVTGIVTSDFSEGANTRNQSGEITLSKELQESIVKRLRKLLSQQKWGKKCIEEVSVVQSLDTILSQIEISEMRTKDQWITHFNSEWLDAVSREFDRIVKQAIKIIVANTKNRVPGRQISTRVTNAHYKMEWENITMSTDLEKQIQFQIQQISDDRTQVQRERPGKEALARSLKPVALLDIQSLPQAGWWQIAWRRTVGSWGASWDDLFLPARGKRIWKKWPSDGNDD